MTNRSRPTRSGPVVKTLFAILFLSYLMSGTPVAAQSAPGSGLSSTEGNPIAAISTPVVTDTLWASSIYQRWMMSNHGSGSVIPVMAWPCQTLGCIVYSNGSPIPSTGGGYYTETALPIGAVGTPLLVTNVSGNLLPQWGGVNLTPINALSGNGTTLATSSGTVTSTSGLAQWDGSGNLKDSGIPAADSFFQTQTVSTASQVVGNIRQLRYWAVYLRHPLTVSKVDFFVNTIDASNNYDMCIYDNAGGFGGTGNLKIHIGQQFMGTAGLNEVSITPTVTLPAGWYTFAWSSGGTNTAAFAADISAGTSSYITPYASGLMSNGNSGGTATCPNMISVPAATVPWTKSSLMLWEGLHN